MCLVSTGQETENGLKCFGVFSFAQLFSPVYCLMVPERTPGLHHMLYYYYSGGDHEYLIFVMGLPPLTMGDVELLVHAWEGVARSFWRSYSTEVDFTR